MCFKKPALPAKTAEDIQTEDDLKAMRAAQQREIALGITAQKDYQTEASFARIMGMVGNRSLISGPKGGAGYIGNNTGRTTGRVTGGAPIAPNIAPTQTPVAPIMGVNLGTIANFSGYSSGNIASVPAAGTRIANNSPYATGFAGGSLISSPIRSGGENFIFNNNVREA